jgi:L-ribulose-5-phosphate 3-epimerase
MKPMNRRDFLNLTASVGAAAFAGSTSAEVPLATSADLDVVAAPVAGASPWKIDIYSRHLQWTRDPNEIGEAAKRMGFDGVNVTVRTYPGHVEPAKVKTDLPPFVKAIRSHGVEVHAVTAYIADVTSPYAEDIIATAASLGIKHYWWGSYQYVKGQPIMPQLEAIRPRAATLAKLNEKHGICAMYHTYGGEHTVNDKVMVSGPMWDLLYVLKDIDPRFAGIQWDSCHMTNAGGMRTWELNLRTAGPYIRGVAWKDSLQEKTADGRWMPQYMPLGHGNVELVRANAVLREIGFDGPMEIQPEHMKGAAGEGMDKLQEPKDWVYSTMSEDLKMLRSAIAASETYKL